MKLTAITSLLAFSVAATGAFAGGPTTPVVLPPIFIAEPENDWTGFYAGLNGGAGKHRLYFGPIALENDHRRIGFHGGYLRDLGTTVVGGELSFDRSTVTGIVDPFYRTGLVGIVGIDADRLMPYALAGISHLQFPGGIGSETGYTIGVGLSVRATDNIIVSGQISRDIYSDLFGIPGINLESDNVTLKVSFQF